MIADNLKNSELYLGVNSRFASAFAFIQKAVAENYPAGRYEIDGGNLYAMVQEYDTKLAADAKFEGHKRYIDIQFIVSGAEVMQVAGLAGMTASTEYNEQKDCTFYANTDSASTLLLQQGEYAIFFPHDIHRPGIAPNGSPAAVRKIVVKVIG